jgi:hypothetical protein
VVNKPTRVKTGRLDTLKIIREKGLGSILAALESHQANISQSQAKRLTDQKEIDATDTGMDYLFDLVNKPGGASAPTKFSGRSSRATEYRRLQQ